MNTTTAVSYRIGNEKLVKVTPNAGAKLTSLLTRQGRPQGALRVAVIGGGCSGLQYKMDLVDGPLNRDILVESAGVRVGDLLTTSEVPGHAMRAVDGSRCFGAVLGKALRPLPEGRGIVPILVALQ